MRRNAIKNKLKRRSGETLVESLVSLLVVSLALVMLAGAIIAAGRIKRTANDVGAFILKKAENVSVRVDGDTIIVSLTRPDDGSLYYYEYAE